MEKDISMYACVAKSKDNEYYTCAACSRNFKTICLLHVHLGFHDNGGSYYYSHSTKTAYLRFNSVCVGSQTEFKEVSASLSISDSVDEAYETIPSDVKIKHDPEESDHGYEAYEDTFTNVIKHKPDYSNGLPDIKEIKCTSHHHIMDVVNDHSNVKKQVLEAKQLVQDPVPIEDSNDNIQTHKINIDGKLDITGSYSDDKVSNIHVSSNLTYGFPQQSERFHRGRVSQNNDAMEVIQPGNTIPRDEHNQTKSGFECQSHLQSYSTQPSIMVGQLYKNVSNQTTVGLSKYFSPYPMEDNQKKHAVFNIRADNDDRTSGIFDSFREGEAFHLKKSTPIVLHNNSLLSQHSSEKVASVDIDKNNTHMDVQPNLNQNHLPLEGRTMIVDEFHINNVKQALELDRSVNSFCNRNGNEVTKTSSFSTKDVQGITKNDSNKVPTKNALEITILGSNDCEDMLNHPSDKIMKMSCTYCKASFLSETELRNHAKTHKVKDSVEMLTSEFYVCGKKVITNYPKFRKKQVVSNCNSKKKPKEMVKCDKCGKTFRSKYIKNHVANYCNHEGRELFKCEECGEILKSQRNLTLHKDYVHLRKGLSKCEQCGQSVKHLNSHIIRVHCKNKPKVKCEICDKTFSSKVSLYKHKLIHVSAGKNQCSFCGKLFHQRSNMRAHMRQHTNEKPFKCDICGEGFTHNVSKKNHMAKHHK